MGKHTFYRIINILVLPISAFLGLQVLMSIFFALANPAMLLAFFVIACVPIYAFTANYFYNKSIRKGEQCKPSLKDWIKVNAIVSLIFSVLVMFACGGLLLILNDPQKTNDLLNQLNMNTTTQVSLADFRKLLRYYIYFFLPFSILLLIHIIITFRILGRYRHMFGYSTDDPQ